MYPVYYVMFFLIIIVLIILIIKWAQVQSEINNCISKMKNIVQQMEAIVSNGQNKRELAPLVREFADVRQKAVFLSEKERHLVNAFGGNKDMSSCGYYAHCAKINELSQKVHIIIEDISKN